MDEREKRMRIIICLLRDMGEPEKQVRALERAKKKFEASLTPAQQPLWEDLNAKYKVHDDYVSLRIFRIGMAHQRTLDEERTGA